MRVLFNEILGEYIQLNDKVNKVVSLSPAITETIYYCGLENLLQGVSVYCVHPIKARKRRIIGAYNNVKMEILKEINPEIIFMVTGYQRECALNLSKDFNVWVIPLPVTLTQLINTLTEVIKVMGYYENSLMLETNMLSCLTENLSKKCSVKIKAYLEIDLGGPVSFGAHSYITNTLSLFNISTPFENYPVEWLEPDISRVIEFAPEIIFYEPKMFSKRMRTLKEVKEYFIRRVASCGFDPNEIPAVRNNRIFITPGNYDFFAHHGPSFITQTIPWLLSTAKNIF